MTALGKPSPCPVDFTFVHAEHSGSGLSEHKRTMRIERIALLTALIPYVALKLKTPCSNKCGIIGLHISSEYWEYLMWVIVKEIKGRMPRIEHLHLNNISAGLSIVEFVTCAVLESSNDK
jgi:hypothetical protein